MYATVQLATLPPAQTSTRCGDKTIARNFGLMLPYLTDSEIADVCEGIVQPAAQRRYLRRLGCIVAEKPNGKPLLARAEFERVLVGRAAEAQNLSSGPNRAALIKAIAGGKRGTQTQGR